MVMMILMILMKVMIVIMTMMKAMNNKTIMMFPTNRDSPFSGDAVDRAHYCCCCCYCRLRASSVSQDICDLLTEVLQKERFLLHGFQS